MKPCILTFALLPLTASAQLFNFGLQGGVPAQTPLGQSYNMPFVLGPSVDIRRSAWLSLETGVLYNRIGRSSTNAAFLYPENAVTLDNVTLHGSALEVPILAKFRFRGEGSGWRPFLTAGPTVRRTSITTEATGSVIGSGTEITNFSPGFTAKTVRWNVDPTIGVGMSLRTGRFHIEPEVRYSHWGAGKNGPVRQNQVSYLFGFRF
jgi:hypothetical protein